MIGYVTGKILHIEERTITLLIDGTGLGYDILVSPSILSQDIILNRPLSLWIHHHQSEATQTLFGFSSPDERALFQALLRVSGIGGRTALAVLGLGEETIIKAIALEDDALIATVPGIGKKTAQKMIVEMKGSIDFSKKSSQTCPPSPGNTNTLLLTSLVNMGYDKAQAQKVLEEIPEALSLEERTVAAIRSLAL